MGRGGGGGEGGGGAEESAGVTLTVGDYALGDMSALLARLYDEDGARGGAGGAGAAAAAGGRPGAYKPAAAAAIAALAVLEGPTLSAAAEEECAVCQDPLGHGQEEEEEEEGDEDGEGEGTASQRAAAALRIPACGHAFHSRCLLTWLRGKDTCPVCRAAVVAPH
jgi:hypothetical protein